MKALAWVASLAIVSCQSCVEPGDSGKFLKAVRSLNCVEGEAEYIRAYLDSLSVQSDLTEKYPLLAQIQQWTSERDFDCLFTISNNLLMDIALETADDKLLLDIFRTRGLHHFERCAFDSAYHYYDRGMQFASGLHKSHAISDFLYPMAVIDYHRNNIDDAEYAALKILQLESKKEQPRLFETYSLLGNIKTIQRRYAEAADYHNNAFNHVKYERSDFERATYFNNIGNVFEQRGELEKALCFYNEGLQLKQVLRKEPILHGALVSNRAMVQLKLGKISPQEAVRRSKVWDEFQIPAEAAYRQRQLADYYLRKGDTVNAQNYAYSALQKVDSLGDYPQMREVLRFLIPVIPDTKLAELQKYLNALTIIEEDGGRVGRKSYAEVKMERESIVAERGRAKEDFSLIGSVASGIVFCTLAFHSFNLRNAKRRLHRAEQKKVKLKRALKVLAADVYDKIEFARFEEKERIARDLHDDVMNELASVRIKMSAAILSAGAANSQQLFSEYQEKVQHIERQIRGIAHGLVISGVDSSNTLTTAVLKFIEEQRPLHEMYINCEIDEDFHHIVLCDKTKVYIFNIIKEAFFNSVKYSKGSQIVVKLIRRDIKLKVIIEDDGIGIPVTAPRGLGLRNMAQRASEMGGRLTIKQAESKGTSVELKLKRVNF